MGRNAAAIDVDDVAEAMEGEEADPDRQRDMRRHVSHVVAEEMQQFPRGIGKEAEIFEDPEHAEIDGDQSSPGAACARDIDPAVAITAPAR